MKTSGWPQCTVGRNLAKPRIPIEKIEQFLIFLVGAAA